MNRPPAKLIVLGIDAASPALIERWTADGTLPALARLRERGVHAAVHGVEGFYVGSTWPSMYTGVNPARHGVHYLLQLEPGTYRLHEVAHAEFVRRPAFWDALSRTGRRVAVLDVPLTRLNRSLNGIQVVEWGGHDSLYGFRASPDDLAADIVAAHGIHPLGGRCDRRGRTAQDYAAFIATLEEGARRKGAWTRMLLDRGDWDLFMQVFTESHCAGHQCWHLHDGTHPAHDAEYVRQHGDPLRRVYRAIDAAIGEVLRDAEDAHVVVFSAHGMAHRFGAQFLLRDVLVRLGVTVPLAEARAAASPLRSAAEWGWGHLPEPARAAIRALRRRSPSKAGTPPAPSLRVDVARSRCFPLNNGLAVGGIRLNLRGREPTGIVEAGAEADALVAELTQRLLELTDARTGHRLVRQVTRTSERYAGEHLDLLPDLLVEWSDADPLGSIAVGPPELGHVSARSRAIGEVSGVNDYARTGEHRPNGWLIAAGPGIAPGQLPPVSLLDLAPTAAAMLGVPLADADGTPISALVSPSA